MNRALIAAFVVFWGSCVFGHSDDPDCRQYCRAMEENCDKTSYQSDGEFDDEQCLDACVTFDRIETGVPFGDPVPDSNSLECRAYHANNAAGDKNGIHCAHAGLDGADTCVQFKPPCDAYCTGAGIDGFSGVVEFCISTEFAYQNVDDCAGFCNALPAGNEQDRSGNTRYCFLNRAVEAAEAADTGQCEAATRGSTVCAAP